MDCHIHLAGEKRSLDFGREQSLPAGMGIDKFGIITACDDDFSLNGYTRAHLLNRFLNKPRLRARELAAACAEDEFSSFS